MDDAYSSPRARIDPDAHSPLRYPLSRYLWRFTGFYVLFTAMDTGIAMAGFDSGVMVSVLILGLSAWLAGRQFVLDHERVPSPVEQRKLVWRSLAIVLAIGLATLAVIATLLRAS